MYACILDKHSSVVKFLNRVHRIRNSCESSSGVLKRNLAFDTYHAWMPGATMFHIGEPGYMLHNAACPKACRCQVFLHPKVQSVTG